MSDEVRIEQMKLAETGALLAFLREVFADNPRMSDERFWNWHFPENPYVEKDNLPVWLAKSGERIAGQLAAIPVRLKVGDEQKQAIWILDLIVHKDFRRRGIAKKLAQAAEDFCPIGLGVNTAAQYSTQLLQGRGWRLVSNIPRYSKLLFAGNAVRDAAKIKLARKSLNLLSAPFRPRFDKEIFGANSNLKLLDKFDSSFDKLWSESCDQTPCAVIREAKVLEWQYIRQPGKKFDIIGYFDENELRGYAVLFFRKPENGGVPKAAITDIRYHPSKAAEIVDELLRGALQLAVERQAGTLVTDAIDKLFEERLRHFNFTRVKNPLQLLVKSAEHHDLLYNQSNWFLTRGDADISIFEQPNIES